MRLRQLLAQIQNRLCLGSRSVVPTLDDSWHLVWTSRPSPTLLAVYRKDAEWLVGIAGDEDLGLICCRNLVEVADVLRRLSILVTMETSPAAVWGTAGVPVSGITGRPGAVLHVTSQDRKPGRSVRRM
jgi:hypothetical protein